MSTLEATEGALLNREKVYQRMCCAAVLALFRRHKCPLKPCQRGGEWIVMAVGSRGAFDGPSGGLRTKTRVQAADRRDGRGHWEGGQQHHQRVMPKTAMLGWHKKP